MTPFDKINLKHRIVFEILDEKAVESGFKDWDQMKLKNNIQKSQSFPIEELIRSALNKFDMGLKE